VVAIKPRLPVLKRRKKKRKKSRRSVAAVCRGKKKIEKIKKLIIEKTKLKNIKLIN